MWVLHVLSNFIPDDIIVFIKCVRPDLVIRPFIINDLLTILFEIWPLRPLIEQR